MFIAKSIIKIAIQYLNGCVRLVLQSKASVLNNELATSNMKMFA